MLAELVGERANRRHRPGRGFEAVRYRFEIVSDYGAFRDLQRHRMLTVQWQGPRPTSAPRCPRRSSPPVAASSTSARWTGPASRQRLRDAGLVDAAPYALCLGYRIRYVLDMNAREAMHLTELRSAREGHASYRAVAQAMHDAIADVHPPSPRRSSTWTTPPSPASSASWPRSAASPAPSSPHEARDE